MIRLAIHGLVGLNDGKWELLIEADDVYATIDEWVAVTHWMPMPSPVED